MDEIRLEEMQSVPKLIWSDRTEQLLISWADISRSYSWLHEKSFRKFNRSNYYFSIPMIILSTISGAVSVSISGYIPPEYSQLSQLLIGTVNIFTGIMTTLQNFFRYAQNSQSHYTASIGWSKLARNISTELLLERERRKPANEFIKIAKAEYERLLEQSPVVPSEIILSFKNVMKKYPDLIVPDIIDVLGHTEVFKEKNEKHTEIINTVERIKSKINLNDIKEEKFREDEKVVPTKMQMVTIHS